MYYLLTNQIYRNIPNGYINSTRWTVVTGQHRGSRKDQTSQTIHLQYAIMHNFTRVDIPRNDIGLLKLRHPVRVNDFTSPICLPTSIQERPAPRTKCWIVGWGQTSKKIIFIWTIGLIIFFWYEMQKLFQHFFQNRIESKQTILLRVCFWQSVYHVIKIFANVYWEKNRKFRFFSIL